MLYPLLSLTLSGSALALLLLALRYVLLKKMPSTVYYYAWLLVLLRFVLPLPGLIPLERTVQELSRPAVSTSSLPPAEQAQQTVQTLPPEGYVQPAPVSASTVEAEPTAQTAPVQAPAPAKNYVNFKSPAFWTSVWAVGATISFAWVLASYMLFTARVRRSLSGATAEDRRVYRTLPGQKPQLYRCAAYNTPLMFGILRPLITLPEQVYNEELLRNILRHELMHYRRRDTLYKWFAVAVLSTQWFNPLSYLIRRELNRACELSCDEMLLRGMDRADKLSYGNTLLTMASAGALPAGVVATTFSTEKRNLKERLEQIMNYKQSRAHILAAVLTVALLLGCGGIAGPAPAAADNAGRVSTVDELLAAIAPDTVIELAPGTFDLSSASNYGEDTHSLYYSWNEVYDGYELVLYNVQNLTIRGAGPGETILTAVPRYANVLRFSGCQGMRVEALTAGHTTEPGFCTGGVLYFDGCENSTVDACGLYGCGILGVQARDCTGLTVKNSDIYECSYGAVSLHQCRNVQIEGCDIHDHGKREGDAMFLFDVNYSDNVILNRNRIHANSAQYLLNSDYARRVLFLSNEVTDNRFPAKVFSLTGYSVTVDGCAFEGNDVSHGWYSGSGVYASNLYGEILEGAMLAEMTLQELNPDDIAPPVSPSGSLEVAKGGSVTVTTVDELLAALGPDRTIILDGTLFDLSTASNYGAIGTDCYYWMENVDGPQLVIHDLNGLAIQAKNTESGATTLAAIPRYADVISFRNCDNLFLGGFTAGHTKEPGACSGGVLSFQNCHQVRLEKMRLFGCGILGIQADQCSSLDILRTEIYECSQGAAQFFRTDGIRFDDCDIHDVPSPALRFNESGDKTWNGEAISGLNGDYDVDENGALVTSGIESGDGETVVSIPTDSPEYAFLSAMQKAIAQGDWETLADNMAFPLTIIIPSEKHETNYVHIPDKETFLSRELDQIMNAAYRRYVENAQLESAAPTIWGYAALDSSLCFAFYPNAAPKVTALIIDAARVMGDTQGLGSLSQYVYSVPLTAAPTPMPEGIRVLFYETEIKTDFTIYPGDPIELRADVTRQGVPITWSSDHPDVLRVESTDYDTARVSCADDGSLPQTCKLTVRCGGMEKVLTVYCRQ